MARLDREDVGSMTNMGRESFFLANLNPFSKFEKYNSQTDTKQTVPTFFPVARPKRSGMTVEYFLNL